MTQQNLLKTFKQEQKKNELLLYGHLYVIALLICAFLLMEKKNKEIDARNVRVYIVVVYFSDFWIYFLKQLNKNISPSLRALRQWVISDT